MATIKSFEELEIWKTARALNKEIIELVKIDIVQKDFRFKDQIKAASGSVMDNIAEGFERESRLEFINFLSYSKGSIGEVRSQLYRGIDMNYWVESDVEELKLRFETLSSHIANFIKYLNTSQTKGTKFKNRI
jgi:four helix bundle protein